MAAALASEETLLAALAERYAPPSWAFLRQVGNATGYATKRHLDAVAMGLWPSRGLGLHGFEIKCTRYDWKRELEDPLKADEMARHLDYFWAVVAKAEIIEPGELPDGWGLMALRARKDGKEALVQIAEPRLLHADRGEKDRARLSRSFVAALLRRATEQVTPEAEFRRVAVASKAEGFAAGRASAEENHVDERKRFADLEARVRGFEEASGITIQHRWQMHEAATIGEAVRTLLAGTDAVEQRIARMAATARDIAADAERHLAALQRRSAPGEDESS